MSTSRSTPSSAADVDTAKDLFANYAEYNKTLRTWFVTFGLGGPALFLVNDALALKLKAAGSLAPVAWCFLVGCGLQVVIALLNKNCAWHSYSAKTEPALTKKWNYRLWLKLESWYWLDLIFDVLTTCLFAYAIWKMASTLL
jgi:hypothetical protein